MIHSSMWCLSVEDRILIQDIWSLHPLPWETWKSITNKNKQLYKTQSFGTTGLKISCRSCDWLMLEGVFVVDLRIVSNFFAHYFVMHFELSALTESIWLGVSFCFRNLAFYDVYGKFCFIFHSSLTVRSCIQLDNWMCYIKT